MEDQLTQDQLLEIAKAAYLKLDKYKAAEFAIWARDQRTAHLYSKASEHFSEGADQIKKDLEEMGEKAKVAAIKVKERVENIDFNQKKKDAEESMNKTYNGLDGMVEKWRKRFSIKKKNKDQQ